MNIKLNHDSIRRAGDARRRTGARKRQRGMNIYADKLNAAVRHVWARETKPSKQVTGKLKENKRRTI